MAKLSPEERRRGISTLSAGNMALAVGYVANLFKVPARVAIIDTAPMYKIDAARKYGAVVDLVSPSTMMDYIEHPPHDYSFIHPMADYGLMDGYGTIGIEIVEDIPDVDSIFVPVGAGFLSAGVALAAKSLKPHMRVIGVNAENCPHYHIGFKKGGLALFEYKPTLADGIAGSFRISREIFELVRETLDEVVIVPEPEIARAVRFLAMRARRTSSKKSETLKTFNGARYYDTF